MLVRRGLAGRTLEIVEILRGAAFPVKLNSIAFKKLKG
jgi:hypothetical protein